MDYAKSLSPEQIERLLQWQGYGNPAGRFWFIGMEEGGTPPEEELICRADLWQQVEDLAMAPRPWIDGFNLNKSITSVWDGMCRIAGRFSNSPDWNETSFVRSYQSQKLGRRDGETFLTEILPLPKRRATDWPYGNLWKTREEYETAVRPQRIEMLGKLYNSHRPEFTFCYGITNWRNTDFYQQIFPDRKFEWLIDNESMISTRPGSTVVMMRHFGDWGFTTAKFHALLNAVPV